MFLVDSHCHLNLLNYKDIHKNVSEVLYKAKQKGIKLVLSVSTSISDYNNMIRCVGRNRNDVVFSCGVHPIYLNSTEKFDRGELYNLSIANDVIAIGETGLDYYHKSNNKKQQEYAFREHISIAKEINKPIIIHSRNASKDTTMVLQSENAQLCGGVLHCFSEGIDFARALLNLNFYISFSGIVTFRNSHILQEVIKYVPISNILLETDSPYLTPEPYRGKENQPAYIYEIAKHIAFIKNISIRELAYCTTANFNILFKLKNII